METLLNEILKILNDLRTVGDKITQQIFLETIFKEDLKFPYYKASKIFRNIRENQPRAMLRLICIEKEKNIEKSLYNAIYKEWKIDDIILQKKINVLIQQTVWLTNKERELLKREQLLIIQIRKLMIIGLGKRQLCFHSNKMEDNNLLVGRENDIVQIEMILKEHGKCFLHGINGYGKTTLAQQVGRRKFYKDYIKITYDNNLETALMNSSSFYEKDSYEERKEQLELLRTDILLIIDDVNNDYKTDKDHFSDYIDKLPCNKIIISNYEVEESTNVMYKLEPLSEKELVEIFNRNAGKYTDVFFARKKEIIDIVEKNTFLIILCAKVLNEGVITAEELIRELKECIFHITDNTPFQMKSYDKAQTYNILVKKLYDMVDLEQKEKNMLFAIWIFRTYGIDKRVFLKLMKEEKADILNNLIKKGWVEREVLDRISIHKIVADCINNERRKEIGLAQEIENEIFCQARDILERTGNEKISLSNKWILVFAELALQSERKDILYANYLILTINLCLNNFPSVRNVNMLLSKLKSCNTNFRVTYYIRNFQNCICLMEGKTLYARKFEEGNISDLIRFENVPEKRDEWIDYFDCLASGFELIRKTYLEEAKKYKIEIIWDDICISNMHETKIMQEFLDTMIDKQIMNNTRVQSYFVRLELYYLKFLGEIYPDIESIMKHLSQFAEQFPDVSIEVHRAKAGIAQKDGDVDTAKTEIQMAYEESTELDNPLYEFECLKNKILLFKKCGIAEENLVEDINQMNILIESLQKKGHIPYYMESKCEDNALEDACSNVPIII